MGLRGVAFGWVARAAEQFQGGGGASVLDKLKKAVKMFAKPTKTVREKAVPPCTLALSCAALGFSR